LFFISVLRSGVVIIVATAISYGICKSHPNNTPILILKTVPSGFQNLGAPVINTTILSAIGPDLFAATLILVLEHIAISKSFGRINEYKINPNQELIAIGVTNLIGTLFNAYPATGSFSRTALKSKSGVRTPLAGIFTGAVVILALYALTGAFYWIPTAGLAAIIIHAVGDLFTSPQQVYTYWRIQPLEAIIFLGAVFITVFTTVEDGIYFAIAASGALLLWRIALPTGRFLGQVRVQVGKGDSITSRDIYVPLDRRNFNPSIKVERPPPGVIIYRPAESFTYPNSSRQNDIIVDEAKRLTKRGRPNLYKHLGDRPWNDPAPRKGWPDSVVLDDTRPVLRAVVFDFASVANIDTTGVQALVDTRNQLNRYADREVEFHFANLLSPWVRRALLAGGFGRGHAPQDLVEIAPSVPTPDALDVEMTREHRRRHIKLDEEEHLTQQEAEEIHAAMVPTETPFFHHDIPDLSIFEDINENGFDAKKV